MDFECIICLDEINSSELLLLECCNQPAHLKCIKNWLEKNNILNINLSLCIYCKQYNHTFKQMVEINKINKSNETNEISQNNTIITIFHNENVRNNINIAFNNTRNKKICLIVTLTLSLFTLFLLILILILINLISDSNNKEEFSYISHRQIKQGGGG
jgi:hypothetical protein